MEFRKYMHLERLGNTEVEGIEVGTVYVFPKLDGTNASIWLGDDGEIKAGSRNRVLSLDNDNAGFYNWVVQQDNLKELVAAYPRFTFYGEWLVPHSLKTYRPNAWKDFYLFDIMNKWGYYLPYVTLKEIAENFEVNYLPPLRILKNPTEDRIRSLVEENKYLIEEGMGIGEGIVAKNYDFTNKFGHTVWAKVVANSFKEVHHKEMGAPVEGGISTEERVVDKYVTQHLVDKTFDKIRVEQGEWSSKSIPRLLQTVFYDLVTEETWNFIKEFKNPKIDFQYLNRLTIAKVKELKQEIF